MHIFENNETYEQMSSFQKWRAELTPQVPPVLKSKRMTVEEIDAPTKEPLEQYFPALLSTMPKYCKIKAAEPDPNHIPCPLRIGCVLSGGQASGGHNVIVGLFEYIKKIHPGSQLYGFVGGPEGIYKNQYMELKEEKVFYYKNRGGFDMIGSGRHKIESDEHKNDSLRNCEALKLDGLVIIGGDDSNTNACILAEYFAQHNCFTRVIGCPKTIDGDLKNEFVEVSFGFDTACKTYSELIGNISMDVRSTKKYYHFIRLMGRSASHITLECALLTRPTYAFISEEIKRDKQTLLQLVEKLGNIIIDRNKDGRDYGVVLVPEGLIEFIDEFNMLIGEINDILATKVHVQGLETADIEKKVVVFLTEDMKHTFQNLPKETREQLLLDRDPHGNVQVAKIETEKLLIQMTATYLEQAKMQGKYQGVFNTQAHYFGYEGRCAYPTNFDCDYCYCLGQTAACLIENKKNGLMSTIRNLADKRENWIPGGYPLVSMINMEQRSGKMKPVIEKALTDQNGPQFKTYAKLRDSWAVVDLNCAIGPVQFSMNDMENVPYLCHDKNINEDKLFLSKDIPRKNYPLSNCPYAKVNIDHMSKLAYHRAKSTTKVNSLQKSGKYEITIGQAQKYHNTKTESLIAEKLPQLYNNNLRNKLIEFVEERSRPYEVKLTRSRDLKIGVLFCGRQAPGGQNIIGGLLEYCKNNCSKLYGFKNGTKGLFEGNAIEINDDIYELYAGQGGFHLLGRSADKIRGEGELKKVYNVCADMELDGQVLIGATHTLTDALYLSDYLQANNSKTKVITVPCTVDGNVCHNMLEASVGFDTSSKIYSQIMGNILIDCASAFKYWYFIRIMGRDPSHLALECALRTYPNMAIISEEVREQGKGIEKIVKEIADLVVQRSEKGKNFGTVLIPEGLLVNMGKIKPLIDELNELMEQLVVYQEQKQTASRRRSVGEKEDYAMKLLTDKEFRKSKMSPWGRALFETFPEFTQKQLLIDPDHTGCIEVFFFVIKQQKGFKN